MEAGLAHGMAQLSPEDFSALDAYGARATWPDGFTIYQRGAAADGIFIVTTGRVVLRSRVRAGRGFVPGIATAGETFGGEGLAPTARYVTDARADGETETLHLSGKRFRQLVREQPQHGLTLISQIMAERSALIDRLRELTTLSVEQRLITTLLRMAKSNTFTRNDGTIHLDSARYRLVCELVGATRESVSLVLGRLAGEGIVERKGSNVIVTPSQRLLDRIDHDWLGADIVVEDFGQVGETAVQH